jgi:hypothetical protein
MFHRVDRRQVLCMEKDLYCAIFPPYSNWLKFFAPQILAVKEFSLYGN